LNYYSGGGFATCDRCTCIYIIAYGEGLILYRLVVLDIRLIVLLYYI